MALYKYVKANTSGARVSRWSSMRVRISVSLPSFSFPEKQVALAPAYVQQTTIVQAPEKRMSVRLISASLGMIGLFMIAWVMYPIVSSEILARTKFSPVVHPIPPTSNTIGWEQATKLADSRGIVLSSSSGTSPINSWLPRKQEQEGSSGRTYFLSIPELRIHDARVIIGGTDLDISLIHYGGTGLPGEQGNTVIFGHSILPQFYDPTNYKAVFSMLYKLDKGDEVFLKYDGISYRYVIYSMQVKSPDDISILEQRYDASYVTLVTCFPSGTYWKRLEIRARLEPA